MAPISRNIPRIVAINFPLFFFGVCKFENIGGISVGPDACCPPSGMLFVGGAVPVPASWGVVGILGTSVISGNAGGGVVWF
jgi:hypothetical protein